MNQKIRYALLAGTMLPAFAMAQASIDSLSAASPDGAIVVAQGGTAVQPDPQQKGKQPPPKGGQKGASPKGEQSPAAKGAQPQQLGQPPQRSRQPAQIQQNAQPQTPSGTPPQGTSSGQRRQFGQQPQGTGQPGQAQQELQPHTAPGTRPQGGAPAQRRQFGQQPQGAGQPGQAQQDAQPQTPPGTRPQGGTPAQRRHSGQPPQGSGGQPGQAQQNLQPETPAGRPQRVPPDQRRQFGQPPQGGGAPAQAQPQIQPQIAPGTPQQAVGPGQQRQFGRPGPGQPPDMQQGFSGNVEQLRMHRRERTEAGGRIVIEEPGRRFIVRENGRAFIRHDENERFRRWGAPRMEQRGGEHYAYIARPGGYQVITVTDRDGRLLRRVRRGPDGREIVLIDNRVRSGVGVGIGVGLGVGLAAGVALGLAAPVITIPREQYIVDVSAAPPPLIYDTLEAPPLVDVERPYSLDEIRYNVALRDRMRRIDVDSITFDFGSWEVTPEQQVRLQVVADAMLRVLERRPDEVFLIEAYTDAVGSDVDNLSLSDRRAESVAVILTEVYQIPPENLVTQGYGEQNLKVPVEGPSRENRRVTVRRITPLLHGGVASR